MSKDTEFRELLRNIRIGDTVAYLGDEYMVGGTLRCAEGTYTWNEHRLEGGSTSVMHWLSVAENDDGEPEAVFWTDIPEEEVSPPDEDTFLLDGVAYQRMEGGRARFRSEGTTGQSAAGDVEYIDFGAAGGHRLSYERFGGSSWEMSVGRVVTEAQLTVYLSDQ